MLRRFLVAFLLSSPSLLFAAIVEQASPGVVRVVVRTSPSWDKWTSSKNPETRQWLQTNLWRMMVFSPYFDGKVSWYHGAWVYVDMYAIYAKSEVAKTHPDWILKDPSGNSLYIPWGCHDGTCPQYAGDISNPDFRNWWIANAQKLERIGYRGLWIDDVNMEFRVGNGEGKQVAPLDRNTGKPMTYTNWKRYVAEFMEQVRNAFPKMEILHNAIWFASAPQREADPYVRRELAAADYINLERGTSDHGLTGGSGPFALNRLLEYIDNIHDLGRGVILDNGGKTDEYALASYFLISSGRDGVGLPHYSPAEPFPGAHIDLGDPAGPRETWNGMLRRVYSKGIVLVNPPGNPQRQIQPASFLRSADGTKATQISLGPAEGVVFSGESTSGTALTSAIKVAK